MEGGAGAWDGVIFQFDQGVLKVWIEGANISRKVRVVISGE